MNQDLQGKTILITGANTGIGRATAVALAARGARLFLLGRSEERHREVLADIVAVGSTATWLPLDLGSFASVRECAQRFLALDQPIHVLLNNAGLAGNPGLTDDGFERTFGVNHLGPFLLTELLLERIKASAPSRIVNVSSVAHYKATGVDYQAVRKPTRTITGLPEYQVSKLCNVLHAKELATRLKGTGVVTSSLHPGVIASDVWRGVPWGVRHVMRWFMKSNEEGAATSVHCAASAEAGGESGLYYDECKVKWPSRLSQDPAVAAELRERSAEWVGV